MFFHSFARPATSSEPSWQSKHPHVKVGMINAGQNDFARHERLALDGGARDIPHLAENPENRAQDDVGHNHDRDAAPLRVGMSAPDAPLSHQ